MFRLCNQARSDAFSCIVRMNSHTENQMMIITPFNSDKPEHRYPLASKQNVAAFDAGTMIVCHGLGRIA